jgi:predicted extracellular nuclease
MLYRISIPLLIVSACFCLGAACNTTQNNAKKVEKVAQNKTEKVEKTAKSNTKKEKKVVNDVLTFTCYNVENLFDTFDDPKKEDDAFLPNSDKKWTEERYLKKLNDIAKVLYATGKDDYPSLVGLVEVENAKVLNDLIEKTAIPNNDYAYVHFDSPDVRGIDVALLYDKTDFKPVSQKKLAVSFDFAPNKTTRDILYVEGLCKNETMHVFVNHWSSRREGEKETEPKRMACAKVLKKAINDIQKVNPTAKIIITGDFNDETDNQSITKVLGAKTNVQNLQKTDLFNLSYKQDQNGEGTYNHKGDWNMIDQFIVSSSMLPKQKGLTIVDESVQLFNEDWLMYKSQKYGLVPNRTYGGPNYYGGYSDHLPISIKLK